MEAIETYTNGAPIEMGDYVVYTSGPCDSWDWGRVEGLSTDGADVVWYGSETSTVTPLAVLAEAVAYTDHAAARDAFARACHAV